MTSTAGLTDRLRRHYIRRSDQPGGVFVTEVGLNGHTDRRCDAIYVGFTASSGQRLIGHEVKTSRADWLRELDQPEKADRWASQCHAWYVVAPDAAVVPVEEVPDHWGLLHVDPRSKVRLRVVRRAPLFDRDPSWLIVRSIMARLDTLQRAAVEQGLRQAEFDRRQAIDTEVAKEVARRMERDPERRNTELVAEIQQHTGLDLRSESWHRELSATPEQLAAALAIVKQADKLSQYQALAGHGREIRVVADRFDELQTLTERARQVVAPEPSLLDLEADHG